MTAKRFTQLMHTAVLVAIAASVPAAWGAGGGVKGVEVNNIAAGNAAISRAGNVMTVRTATQNTIINYKSFNIASGETMQFLQPNATSRVLNRIQSAEPSRIDGTIYSNGRVYLVNPAGVMFGEGSVINAAGLITAAGHISNANFLGGVNKFTGNTGSVVNYGTIRAGDIHLVGGSVANFGSILTTGSGVITMTAAKEVYIGETDSPTGGARVLVKVSNDKSATKEGTGVSNAGTVDAGGGQISMGAGDLYAAGIYNNGSLKGAVISSNAGANTNVNEGKIDASSGTGKGGSIEILGDKVGLFAGTVDASGQTGGGSIKIGGDFHGAPGTLASSITIVSAGAFVTADAISSGDGGQVAIWSDQVTEFYGSVSARGGVLSGNGGFVEVSGKKNLAFNGSADVSSPLGIAGTLLFDPETITIVAAGTDNGVLTNSFNTTGNHNYSFSATSIQALSGSVILTATNDIDVNASLSFTSSSVTAFSLISTAGNITLATGVKIESTSQPLTLDAGGNILLADNTSNPNIFTELKSTTGDISLRATGSINLQSSVNDNSAARITTGGGNVTLRANTSILIDAGNSGGAAITTNGGSITLRAGTDLTLEGNGNSAHAALSSTGSGVGGAILLSAGDVGLGGVSGDLTMQNSVTLDSGGGNITFRASDLIFTSHNQTISAGIGVVAFETNNGTTTIGLEAGSGSFKIDNDEIDRITSASLITIGANGAQSGVIESRSFVVAGIPLELNANAGAGGVVFNDNNSDAGITVSDTLTVRAGSGGITATQNNNGFGEIIFSSASKTLTLVSAGAIGTSAKRLGILTFGGSVNVTNTATAGNDVFITGLSVVGLNFVNLTNTLNVTDVISAGDINASGLITGTNIILNASGGIGTNGALPLSFSGTASLTTKGNGSAGNIHILTSQATFGSFTFVTTGTGIQTDTIDSAGDISVGAGITAPAGDALAVNASGNLFAAGATISGTTVALRSGMSGTGNLVLTGANLIGDSITLRAGNGAGSAAVLLGSANFSGSSADVPSVIQIEQDSGIAGIPAFGTTTALTVISHLGTVGINTSQTLLSLAATGTTIVLTGNATVSGAMNFTGLLLLGQNTTLVGGSSLTVTGAIASQGGSGFTLRTNFPGVTTFTGGVDTTPGRELGSLTVDAAGGTLVVGSGTSAAIRTTGAVTIGQPLTLNGSLTVTSTGGGNIRFNGTIDSAGSPHSPLAVSTSGTTTFDGDIGSITPLGGLSVVGGGAVTLGNFTSSSFAISVGSPILFSGVVTLNANTTLTATGGTTGTVTFQSAVNSASFGFFNLTINASDAVTFNGLVGNPSVIGHIGALNVTGSSIAFGNATGSATTVTSLGGQTFSGPVVLQNDVTFNAVSGGNVNFTGLVSSGSSSPHFGISVNTTGDITFQQGTSTTVAALLQSITTGGGGITRFGGSGAVTVETVGSQTYNDQVTLLDNTTFQVTGTDSTLSFAGTPLAMNAGGFDVTLISNSMSFAGTGSSVTGTGHLTILPLTASDNILIQSATGFAANTLVLGASQMAAFSGFALTTVGYANGSGTVSVTAPTTFGAPTLIQSPSGGSISVASNLSTVGSLTLHAGTISLGASLFTDGGAINLQGAIQLTAGPITIQSYGVGAGGNITIAGPIDGARVLNLLANGPGGDGDIDVQGVIGGTTPLTGLNASGGAMTIQANITTAGAINIGTASLLLANAATAGTATISILMQGGLFNATAAIDGDGSGPVNLVIDTSATGAAGPITLSSVGASGTLNNLTLIAIGTGSNGAITLADVTINGAFSSNGGTFLSTGAINTHGAAGISINQTGITEFDAALDSHGNPITISGTQIIASGAVSGSNVTFTGTGLVTISQPVLATGTLSITGVGISTGTVSSLTGVPVVLAGGSGSVLIRGPVNATGGFSSTASGIFSLLSGAPITTNNTNVTINHAGSATINGQINAGSGTVAITAAGAAEGASGLIISNALSLTGTGNFNLQRANQVARLAADVTGILNFGNTVDIAVGTVGAFTGITTHGLPLTLNASGHNITATSPILAGSIDLTGNLITIAGGLVAAGTAGILTATGNTVFNSTATALSVLVTGDATVNADLTATSGDISLLGTSTLNANVTASGNVTLGALTTDVANFSGNHFLVAGGLITMTGPAALLGTGTTVIRAAGAGGVNIDGSLTGSHVVQILATAGSIGIGGVLGLTGSGLTSMTSNGSTGITIGGGITSSQSLNLFANGGSIGITGAVALTGAGNSFFTAGGAGGVKLNGSLDGGQNLTLITNHSAASIALGAVGSGTASRYTGSITLTANSAGNVNGVVLNGDMYVTSLTFDGSHLTVPTVATIVTPGNLIIDAATLIDMKTNQKLTALGSLTLRSHAAATNIGMFLGDLSALGTIVIDAGAIPNGAAAGLGRINLRLRTPQAELGHLGTPLSNDGGLDLVSYSPTTVSALDAGFGTGTNTIAIRGNVSIIGVPGPVNTSTTKVQVTSATANLDILPSADGILNPILLFPPDQGGVLTTTHGVPIIPRIIDPNVPLNVQLGDISDITKQLSASNGTANQITAADLVISTGPLTGTFLDLVPTGTTGDSPTPSAQAALIPQDVQTLFPERGQAISGALAEALQQLGIYARPLDAEELVDELLGRGLYNDTLRVLTPLDSSHTVAVNRLPSVPVIPVVEAARALMYREEKDERGNSKLVSKTDEVAAAIGLAWQAYLDEVAAKNQEPKPAEFRDYLEKHENDDTKFRVALGYLNQIRDLLAQIKQLGLTPTEFDVSRRVILNKLRDKDRIDEKDFALMIDGPSGRTAGKVAVQPPPATKP